MDQNTYAISDDQGQLAHLHSLVSDCNDQTLDVQSGLLLFRYMLRSFLQDLDFIYTCC